MAESCSSSSKGDAKNMNIIRLRNAQILKVIFIFLLSVATRAQIWQGWAENECLCMRPYDPICASDLRRYFNQCVYECRIAYLIKNNLTLIQPVDCSLLPPSSPHT